MNVVTSQSVAYIAHVDKGVLCDEVGHLTPFLLQINQIKLTALLQIQTNPVFRKID